MTGLETNLLMPIGKVLLPAGFAVVLTQAIRGTRDMITPFERLAIGTLALGAFQAAGAMLLDMTNDLAMAIQRLGAHDDLRGVILESLKRAAAMPPSGELSRADFPGVIEQAWRTGVWGLMSALVEGVFLISGFVLEAARDVLWTLLLFLFPLAAGMYTVFPRVLMNLCLYAFELALWFPILCIVERAAATVAKKQMQTPGAWGLYLVAIEFIAIVLIALIPTVTHRFMSGAFSGDWGAQAGVFDWMKWAASKTWATAYARFK